MARPTDILSDYIEPGDVLGRRYEIDSEIDAGSYGVIYLARDRDERRDVAVKALPPRGEGASEKAIGRFERELTVVRNLDHACIVDVVDYGETEDDILFMVMEFIEGETLDHTVREQGAIGVQVALSVAQQIAAALSVAHASGVIHRDLKPANIMLVDEGDGYRVKILDFGMAKMFARLGGRSITALTKDGVAVGTPRYIAPEQAKGLDEIGPWTDLYAVGLLLYEMLVGHKAVPYDDIDRAVAEHVDSDPLELPGLDELPEDVRELVRELTAKGLEQRPESAEYLVDRIDEIDVSEAPDEYDAEEAGLEGWAARRETSEFAPENAGGTRPIYGAVGRAPDREETRERPELDELTEVADDSLEVDWKNGGRGRGDSSVSSGASRNWRGRLVPDSSVAATALGGLVCTAFAFVGFMALTAQFHDFGDWGRALFGLAPTGVAALSAGMAGRRWAWLLCRNVAIFNGIGTLVAHIVGPSRMIHGLTGEPAWFLEPLRGNPVGDALFALVAAVGRGYGELLALVFGPTGGG